MSDTRYGYKGFVCEFDMFSCREFKDMVKHYNLFHKSQRNNYSVMGKLSDGEVKRLRRENKDSKDKGDKKDKGDNEELK